MAYAAGATAAAATTTAAAMQAATAAAVGSTVAEGKKHSGFAEPLTGSILDSRSISRCGKREV